MSNLVKKITSAVAGLAIVFSIVTPIAGVSAAYTSLEAANKLATLRYIDDQSANPSAYRLGDTISRREMAKITMKLSDESIVDSCKGIFADLPSSDWGCKYAESGESKGFFASNSNFRPNDDVSKWESLKFIMQARGIEKGSDADFRKAYVDAAVEAGITEAFSDYDTAITRGMIFSVAAEAIDLWEDDEDLLEDLLGGFEDEEVRDDVIEEETVEVEQVEDTTPVVSWNSSLIVSLSPETPESSTIPGNISGLAVAKYDFTAWSEDVTVTSLTIKRRWLSDKDTLTSLAIFTDEGRASKGKNDSQQNDTEAQLIITDWVVIKAGETKTMTVVADVADSDVVNGDEFAIEIVDITASSTVEEEGSLVGNTMKVGWVNAATIKILTDGNVADPKLGEEWADIFKFKVEWSNDEDVTLKSITFKASDWDAEDDLTNIKLLYKGNVVSTADSVNNKYLTFDLGDGFIIAEDKDEKFVVVADVVSGANDIFGFYVDKQLDVTGEGSRYGYGISVNIDAVDAEWELGNITIQAGELTLADIDASIDKIREDKKDVILGKINVTNVAGKNLELQKFGFKAVSTVKNLNEIFENVELYSQENSTSYELDLAANDVKTSTYWDDDLNITLPQGTVTFIIRADTKKWIDAGITVELSLDATLNATKTADNDTTDGQFYVEETEDDKTVSDLTPSSLTWKKLEVINSGASVAKVPLANTKVVRGAEDEVVMQFEVKADEASLVTVDEAKVKITANAADATNQHIAQVALYKGSVSDSNLLDRISGSNLASGIATFEWFEVEIAADAKQTFVVTANIVDSATVVAASPIEASLLWLSLEDDDNSDVYLTGDANKDGTLDVALDSGKDLTVTNVWELTVAEDTNNEDNEDTKTVLGWESATVFSADVQATNEEIDVETVTFTVDKDLTNAVTNASLYLGDTLIATNSNSDITATTVKFENLTTLIIPEESKELKLKINSQTIGYQKVGATVLDTKVTGVELSDAEWVDSGKAVTTLNGIAIASVAMANSKTFSIVPANVVVSVVETLSNGSAKVKVTVDTGNNTVDANNSKPSITLDDITLTNLTANNNYKFYNEDNVGGEQTTFAALSTADRTVSDNETFVIIPQTTTDGTTYTAKIAKDGVQYDVNGVAGSTNINANLNQELDLGSKTY